MITLKIPETTEKIGIVLPTVTVYNSSIVPGKAEYFEIFPKGQFFILKCPNNQCIEAKTNFLPLRNVSGIVPSDYLSVTINGIATDMVGDSIILPRANIHVGYDVVMRLSTDSCDVSYIITIDE